MAYEDFLTDDTDTSAEEEFLRVERGKAEKNTESAPAEDESAEPDDSEAGEGDDTGGEENPYLREEDPKGFQKRLNQLYGKLKTTERDLDEAKKTSSDETVQQLKQQNEDLRQFLQNAAQQGNEDEEENPVAEIDSQIQELKKARQEFSENMNYDKAMEATDTIAELQVAKTRMEYEQKASEQEPAQQTDPEEIKEKIIVDEWMAQNPWFKQDAKLQAFATGYEKSLHQQGNMNLRERLQEVTKAVEKMQNSGSQKKSVGPLTEGVESHSDADVASHSPLTEQEKALAHGLFPDVSASKAEKMLATSKTNIAKRKGK